MHFASSLLRIFLAKNVFLEFFYEVLLVLSRCCFHYFVENPILYKKDIPPFYIGQILFSENKIIRSVVSGKVDGQIVFGARRNQQFYLAPGMRNEKIYLAPNDSYKQFYLAVKGLISILIPYPVCWTGEELWIFNAVSDREKVSCDAVMTTLIIHMVLTEDLFHYYYYYFDLPTCTQS